MGAWERPLLAFPNLQVAAESGAGKEATVSFDLRESSEVGGALQLQPHMVGMLTTLDMAWEFEGDTQAGAGATLSEHDGTSKRLLYALNCVNTQ